MEHNHVHGDHCECSQEIKTENLAVLYNLYSKIDLQNLECLNESIENSGKSVFRPWDERLDGDKVFNSLLLSCSHRFYYRFKICIFFPLSLSRVMLTKNCYLIFRRWCNITTRWFSYYVAFNQSFVIFRFTGNVKLKGLIIIGGEEGKHPSVVHL